MQKISERKLECRKCPVPKPEKVETRLELACTKFGKQLETNRALVDEMKHLTMERALVIKTYKRLEMELATLSIELAGIVCRHEHKAHYNTRWASV
ncbi:hypothetical protein BaRGS_00036152 [Batillaria attramentaria]|uniref:ODAD1 central coiled coil region domain-containing protein n=1 Tax=Batillaria attramentaria TaxID=370345 RepID=A0ABD0JCN6_9CAEN